MLSIFFFDGRSLFSLFLFFLLVFYPVDKVSYDFFELNISIWIEHKVVLDVFYPLLAVPFFY